MAPEADTLSGSDGKCGRWLASISATCGSMSLGEDARTLAIPMSTMTFSADEGCHWIPIGLDSKKTILNAHYFAAPQPARNGRTGFSHSETTARPFAVA